MKQTYWEGNCEQNLTVSKGSLKSMELRGKEKAKIEYAKKHFAYLSDTCENKSCKLIYKVVESIEDLDIA